MTDVLDCHPQQLTGWTWQNPDGKEDALSADFHAKDFVDALMQVLRRCQF
jgi:hypothetical protein